MSRPGPGTIVLIHGLFLESRSRAVEHATAAAPAPQETPDGTLTVPGSS